LTAAWPGRRGRAEAKPVRAAGGVRTGCEPLALDAASERAVLLLHGFGDTPQTFCYLAPALHKAGFAVHVPLLPGHGRLLEDFDRSSADEWIAASRDSLADLTRRYDSVGLGGLSMGGTIAVLLAAELPSLRALVLMAPYMVMPPMIAAASMSHRVWGRFTGPIQSASNASIRDAAERERNVGYGETTARSLNQLWLLTRRARAALPRVTAPTLVIQSSEDNRLKPRAAHNVLRRLGSTTKRLVFTQGSGHIITVDHGYEAVITEVREWFDAHLGVTPARTAT
jgi:carboxylesterase